MHHEVVVHTPRHARTLAELESAELERIAEAWSARTRAAREAGFGYVQAVVNEGRDAGASLPHSHSQLVWLKDEPPIVADERAAGECAVCDLLDGDARERLVGERAGLLLVCPYAGRVRHEMLLAPRDHESDAFASASLPAALVLLGEAVRRLAAVEGPSPLNAWVHTAAPRQDGHWHIELVPRLTIPASLELGAGIYINTLAPEEAAERLRRALPAA